MARRTWHLDCSINILIDAILEQEKTQKMCSHYSAVSRRDTVNSVDESLVNAVAENDSARVGQKR